MKVTNHSGSIQQINLISESISVSPGDSIDLDQTKLYDFELNRIRNFFTFEEEAKEAKKAPAAKPTANVDKSKNLLTEE